MDRLREEDIVRNPQWFGATKFKQGLWRARVVSVDDPERRGRLQVRILQLHQETEARRFDVPIAARDVVGAPRDSVPDRLLPWAEPAFPIGGGAAPGETLTKTQGHIMLPSVGSTVWVGFELGFVGRPVWLGAWLGANELPSEFTDPTNIRLIKSPAGHLLLFDDTPGSERVLIAEAVATDAEPRIRQILMDKAAGTITISNGTNSITIEESANTTITASGDVTINAINVNVNASGNVVLGSGAALGVVVDSFLTLFNSHIHNDPVSGVTSAPITPAVPGTHSSLTVQAKL